MQDQEARGGRYLIREFDARTWSITDMWTAQAYVLLVNRPSNFNVQLVLVEVLKATGSPRFMHFLREILSADLEIYDDETGDRVARFVLDALEDDLDLANPVTLARQLGADLHGQRVDWVAPKELQ